MERGIEGECGEGEVKEWRVGKEGGQREGRM